MLKEKHMPIIAAIAVILAFAIAISFYALSKVDAVSLSIPNYITKVFDENSVMSIDITVDEAEWSDMLENATNEEYISCDMTINGTKYSTVGIRPKGNSSLTQVYSNSTTDRYSFRLNFSEYIDGQSLEGLDDVALNNMISDPSYMKEYLTYELMEEMGVNTPAYTFANITVNGEAWGLYLAIEVISEDFLERYYGANYGTLYKPESDGMGGGGGGGNKDANADAGADVPAMGEPPQGNGDDGAIPEPPTGDNNDNADNQQPPDMADGKQPPEIPQDNTQATDQTTTGEENQATENTRGNKGFGGGMGGGGMSSGGTSLVYTDDEYTSYENIFNSVVTKGLTNTDKQEVIDMIKSLSTGDDLEKYLDIDEILRYFAVNTFLVNLDSYAGPIKHNYYLYEEDGVFQILPWDFNLSFGTFQMSDASKIINFPIDEPVTDTMENSPLISTLLSVDEYRQTYHEYLQQIIDNYFTSGTYEAIIDKLDTLISDYVKNDATAFYTYDEYVACVEQLRVFGTDRTSAVQQQLSGEQPTDSYGTFETSLNAQSLGQMGGGGNKNRPIENQEEVTTNTGEDPANTNDSTILVSGNITQPSGESTYDNTNSNNQSNNSTKGDDTNVQQSNGQMGNNNQNMREIMSIIRNAGDRDLTDDELSQLSELGADEQTIESIKNRSSMGGNMDKPSMNSQGQATTVSTITPSQIGLMLLYTSLIVVGIFFIFIYKTKKYSSK